MPPKKSTLGTAQEWLKRAKGNLAAEIAVPVSPCTGKSRGQKPADHVSDCENFRGQHSTKVSLPKGMLPGFHLDVCQ
jgi:hypothetical protein